MRRRVPISRLIHTPLPRPRLVLHCTRAHTHSHLSHARHMEETARLSTAQRLEMKTECRPVNCAGGAPGFSVCVFTWDAKLPLPQVVFQRPFLPLRVDDLQTERSRGARTQPDRRSDADRDAQPSRVAGYASHPRARKRKHKPAPKTHTRTEKRKTENHRQRERETKREGQRHTDRRTDRHSYTDGQTHTQTSGHAERRTQTHTHTHTHT
eukprot:COSAG02_NODE_5071_length_4668_cov_3.398555_3_plen_210_part_00